MKVKVKAQEVMEDERQEHFLWDHEADQKSSQHQVN